MALLLTPEQADFIQSGISLSAASRSARLLPSVTRAYGCRVQEDGRLQLWFSRQQGKALWADAFASDQLALVVSHPPSHRTWQVKGDSVLELRVMEADEAWLRSHIEAFIAEVGQIGFSPSFVEALYPLQMADVVSLSFMPRELFEQTPGPKAGQAMAPAGPSADPGDSA